MPKDHFKNEKGTENNTEKVGTRNAKRRLRRMLGE
jgi:hypothetical protein